MLIVSITVAKMDANGFHPVTVRTAEVGDRLPLEAMSQLTVQIHEELQATE